MWGLIAAALIVCLCWPCIQWLISRHNRLAGLVVRMCCRVPAVSAVSGWSITDGISPYSRTWYQTL
jgi:hypothetical protein